jgi:hypothetical protein
VTKVDAIVAQNDVTAFPNNKGRFPKETALYLDLLDGL